MNDTPGNIATQVSAALESVKHDNELGAALPGPVPRQALERRPTEQFSQVQQLDMIAGEAAGGKRGFPDPPND